MYELADHTSVMTVDGSVTSRTTSSPFLGQSTGSSIIGGFGVGFDPDDLTSNDQLFDLTGTLRTPPNNVTFTVSGLISGEDRVLVGPRLAGVIDVAQDTINGTLNSASTTAVVVTTAIPTDTPTSGTIRVEADDGRYLRVPYESYTGSTYTLPTPAASAGQIDVDDSAGTFTRASGDFVADGYEPGMSFTGANFANGGNNAQFTILSVTTTVITVLDSTGMVTETGSGDETVDVDGYDFSGSNAATTGNNVYISYIDELASGTSATFTSVFLSNRDVFVRVRDGGGTPIKTFEAPSQLTSAGGGVSAIRTTDE